jgi:hypothetical protein
MKRIHHLTSALVLLLLLPACGNNTRTADSESATGPQSSAPESSASAPAADAVGTVANIRTQVYVGALDNLVLIDGETDLGNNDYVKVADGGKARLEFPGPISLLLYNESEMDNLQLEFDSNSNPRIASRLIRGGFSGYVEPGNQLTIDLAFGVQVNVLGTHFFVMFDEENGYLTIGKFDGTMSVSAPGQPTIYLDDLEMIDIDSAGVLTHHAQLPFTIAQFDTAADSCVSPIHGLNILRRHNNIAQPGGTEVEVGLSLPCDPLPSSVILPNTGGCLEPMASVKARTVQLREGPDLRFISMGEYRTNDEFKILGRYQGWYNVEFAGGKKGWLYIDWINMPPDVDINKICVIPYRDLPPTPKRDPICRPSTYVQCP